jgi:hypothetical protein
MRYIILHPIAVYRQVGSLQSQRQKNSSRFHGGAFGDNIFELASIGRYSGI